jgi:hypothetical protein
MFPFKQHLENGTGQFCTDSGIPSGILPSIGTARVPPVALNPLFQSEQSNEYLYIIGVVVVVIVVAGYLGLHL